MAGKPLESFGMSRAGLLPGFKLHTFGRGEVPGIVAYDPARRLLLDLLPYAAALRS